MSGATADGFGIVGTTLAGKYAIERAVARGGFGTVYKARHLELETAVAVKVLMVPERYEGDVRTRFLEKFKLEARTIAALNHAAIVRVLDYGLATLDGAEVPWMALEWLEGTTLEADLEARRDQGGRSPRTAFELLRPALEALACAHEAGVAHRDVKPANLMLVKARRGEAPLRVLDFGIAKVMDADERAGSGFTATAAEFSAFSLAYAAAEQVSRTRTGPWTDVHALGLILAELLTGQSPYPADNATQMVALIVSRDRPTPGQQGVSVGPWEPILQKALALTPADRHPDAGALLAALESTVDDAQRAWEDARSPRGPVTTDPARASHHDTLATATREVTPSARTSKWWVPVLAGAALAAGAFVWAATRGATDGGRAGAQTTSAAARGRLPPAPVTRVAAQALPAPSIAPPPSSPAPDLTTPPRAEASVANIEGRRARDPRPRRQGAATHSADAGSPPLTRNPHIAVE